MIEGILWSLLIALLAAQVFLQWVIFVGGV